MATASASVSCAHRQRTTTTKEVGMENTHPLLRAAPIPPAIPEYAQAGDDDPDDGYCNPTIIKSIGAALASPVQMRQRQRMGRSGVVIGAGGNTQGDKKKIRRGLYVMRA